MGLLGDTVFMRLFLRNYQYFVQGDRHRNESMAGVSFIELRHPSVL